MKKCNKNLMDLNRETAMRLWVKTYGKETKVQDFTGRTIVKGAYNDRNSNYGWNVDHILPQSKGGVTADHNLICCHILTNDEKADKFPCFTANSIKFEIIKVQNHYELKQVKESDKPQNEINHEINFYDSADGIRLFKKLKGTQNEKIFVGTILISLKDLQNYAVVDFIEKIFDEENILYEVDSNNLYGEIRIYAKNCNIYSKEDASNLLDKCILLNTYLGHYFEPQKYIDNFNIYYGVDCYEKKEEMYIESQTISFEDINVDYDNMLYINNLVVENTEAKGKVQCNKYSTWTEYNYIYTNLSKNLDKEVNGK